MAVVKLVVHFADGSIENKYTCRNDSFWLNFGEYSAADLKKIIFKNKCKFKMEDFCDPLEIKDINNICVTKVELTDCEGMTQIINNIDSEKKINLCFKRTVDVYISYIDTPKGHVSKSGHKKIRIVKKIASNKCCCCN